jgi:hypothetical protein
MSNNSAGHVAAAIFISLFDTYKKEPDPTARSAIIRAARKAWLEQWKSGADYGTYEIQEFGRNVNEALEGLGLARIDKDKYPGEDSYVFYGEDDWK